MGASLLVAFTFSATIPKVQIGVTPADVSFYPQIPSNAVSVNHVSKGVSPSELIEFRIDEDSFVAWCNANQWKPVPVEGTTYVSRHDTFPDIAGASLTTSGVYAITDGLVYTEGNELPDADAGLTVVFDRTTGWVFAQRNSR